MRGEIKTKGINHYTTWSMGDCPDILNRTAKILPTIVWFTAFQLLHILHLLNLNMLRPPYDPNDDYQKSVHGLLGGMGFPGVNRHAIFFRIEACIVNHV